VTIPTLGEQDFDALRRDPRLRKHLRLITPDHTKALGCYLLMLPVWMFTAVYGGYALDSAGLYPGHWLFFALLALAVLVPLLPIFTARRHLRRAVLDRLADLNGLDYASHDFELKGFEAARPILFGEDASDTLTDLLASAEGGKAWAICHAEIEAGGEAAFAGLLYWFGRRGKSSATVAIVPAAAAARPKLLKKMRRIATGDAAFDAAFATCANAADEAGKLLDDDLRRLLLDLANAGPVCFSLARNDVFLTAARPPSFESAGDSALGRERRLRAIFDNTAAALELVRTVRASIDRG